MTENGTPGTEPVPRRCLLPTHNADRLMEGGRKNVETPKFMADICGVVTGHKSRSEAEFVRTHAFMIQNDINSTLGADIFTKYL